MFAPEGRFGVMSERSAVGNVISRIGKKANVVVDVDPRSGRKKFASAHDFRRAFGERWSKRLMPADLKELMRHAEIGTTMKYYVGANAQRTNSTLWAAFDDSMKALA